jgi:ATP-dependent Lon protease
VALNPKIDTYEAEFSNLGLKGVPISSMYVKEFDKLLVGGLWRKEWGVKVII